MMKQVALLSSSSSSSPPKSNTTTSQKLEFSKDMTIKGKKNSKVKIVTNKKRHNYWGNIFRRKRIMSEYFSDSAFGSQSDTKIELYNPWEDPELLQKQIKLKYLEYQYDENEIMPTTPSPNNNNNNNKFDISKVSFMHEPPPPPKDTYHNNKNEDIE